MKTKKILHICHSMNLGGVSSVVKNILTLNGTDDAQHDLLLISDMDRYPDLEGICRIHRLEYKKRDYLQTVIKAKKISRQYDMLIFHSLHPIVALAAKSAKNQQKLLFQHGMTFSSGSKIRSIIKRTWFSILPLLLNASVVCSTDYAKYKLRKSKIFVAEKRVHIIPFGIDIPARTPYRENELSAKRDGISIGMAGRLVRQKRFDRVLRSFVNYHGNEKYVIYIAGEGPELDPLKAIADSISNNHVEVSFMGHVQDMNSFYRNLDMFILPSEAESLGLVVMEALVRNIPVAVFEDVGGVIVYLEKNRNAFIFENEEQFGELWMSLNDNPAQLQSMSRYIAQSDMDVFDIKYTRKQINALVPQVKI